MGTRGGGGGASPHAQSPPTETDSSLALVETAMEVLMLMLKFELSFN